PPPPRAPPAMGNCFSTPPPSPRKPPPQQQPQQRAPPPPAARPIPNGHPPPAPPHAPPAPQPVSPRQPAPPPPPAAAGGYPLRKSLSPGVVSQYNYQEVQAATQSFSTEIGRGGFGVVFHGRLADPQGGPPHEVAVKLMAEDHITNGIDSFITEVGVMARVHHPNILRLEGYVVGATPILIYDYVSMGDVSTYLAKAARGEVSFTWKQRVAVALGCAEALTTIHANNFVHRDFKATNVLLRQDLTPVVADFGLARAVDDWKTHVQTRVMGSVGYIDPIYFDSGEGGGWEGRYGVQRPHLLRVPPVGAHARCAAPSCAAPSCALPSTVPASHVPGHWLTARQRWHVESQVRHVRAWHPASVHPTPKHTTNSKRLPASAHLLSPLPLPPGMLSRKSDTYAFGIFLLELVSGCSALDARFKDLRKLVTAKDFPDPALVLDPQLHAQWQLKQVLVAFTLIKFAIFFDWEHRPGMDVLRDKLKNLINDM
ncbi:unnamed protein product, partial [Closterium sp. Naga37s-1]